MGDESTKKIKILFIKTKFSHNFYEIFVYHVGIVSFWKGFGSPFDLSTSLARPGPVRPGPRQSGQWASVPKNSNLNLKENLFFLYNIKSINNNKFE